MGAIRKSTEDRIIGGLYVTARVMKLNITWKSQISVL